MPRPVRKALRLGSFDYTSTGAYFVTVCTAERRCIFGDIVADDIALSSIGALVRRCWLETPVHFRGAELDAFVVMPDHLQAILFLARATHASPLRLGTVVGSFKAASSRLARQRLWQRGYHDRIIRSDAELEALRRYIAENPLCWVLARENQEAP